MDELYRKYRPTKLSQVLGQDGVVAALQDFGRRKSLPHFILLSGPSGCGKTTLARILKIKLKCSDQDFNELNAADFRGIDMVREIRSRMGMSPIKGETRIWLLDEAAKMTTDGQNAFLKMLEDTPSHVYFFFCTTEPQRLIRTVRNRATELKVKPLSGEMMGVLLREVIGKEEVNVIEEVVDKIVDVAEGSPRKALVLLNQVMGMVDETKQLAAVEAGVASREAIELARALMNPRTSWGDVAAILKGIEDLDNAAEGIRWLLLSYMSSVAVNNPRQAARASEVIDVCRDHFYDSKRAGLIACLYELVAEKR